MILEDTAIAKLKDLLAEENNPNIKLRVFVQGGGCSGMSYGFTMDEEQNEDDFAFEFDTVNVVVDSVSYQYLEKASIRYEEGAMGSSFAINNPEAVSTCGCGSSFSI
jgi:iron-sulfur cluster insertion protein|tara:strand:- start:443 stop:763 length:321 start_codon:yes stop_codon:yes gene_type:complete